MDFKEENFNIGPKRQLKSDYEILYLKLIDFLVLSCINKWSIFTYEENRYEEVFFLSGKYGTCFMISSKLEQHETGLCRT